MPAVQAPAKVLVTGANGYIAVWLVRTLLERGYSVRGTIRTEDKGEHLNKLFKSYVDQGKFELVVVADIEKEGAFDEAVKGVDAVEHTASPFHMNAQDPKELIDPAVQGTTGVLKSIVAHNPNVKRVVVTSSCASVLSDLSEPKVFSEEDWNEQAIGNVEKEGKEAAADRKYKASKTLAEKAAWAFYSLHKSKVNWELVCINPPFVFGPAINDVPSPSSLGTSAGNWFQAITQPDHGGQDSTALKTSNGTWVDVRDVALAHVLALEKPNAGNERFIVSSGTFCFQDFLDVAAKLYPDVVKDKGVPGAGKGITHLIQYDTKKEQGILGIKYKTMEETTRDTIEDFKKRGWVH